MFDMFKNWKRQEIDKYNTSGKSKKKQHEEIDPEKAKIIRKLKHKTKYLDIEFQETSDLLEKAKNEFFSSIRDFCTKNPDAVSPLCNIPKEDNKERKDKSEDSEEVKSIYREIAKATHPDKNPGEEEEAKQMFITASEAKENNKIEDLINISFDLDIDISNISIELIEELELSLIKKEKKIQEMRQDTSVKWFNSPQDIRDQLILQICPIKNKKE